jgi:hypothetical protein
MPAIRQKLVAGAVMVLVLQLSEGVVTVVCEKEEKAEEAAMNGVRVSLSRESRPSVLSKGSKYLQL